LARYSDGDIDLLGEFECPVKFSVFGNGNRIEGNALQARLLWSALARRAALPTRRSSNAVPRLLTLLDAGVAGRGPPTFEPPFCCFKTTKKQHFAVVVFFSSFKRVNAGKSS
jgi:hypothetical protein